MITLRDYQERLIEQVQGAFASNIRRVLIQLPTGGGKGRILPRLARLRAETGRRVLIVAHRAELIDQISAALDDEGLMYGRIQPGHPRMDFPVQVGMVQTVSRRLKTLRDFDDIMVDEAHHMPAGQYTAMLKAWPNAALTGLTATPIRTDGAGLGDYFDQMFCGPTTDELIRRGYLAGFDYYMPSRQLDLSGVGKSMGDYQRDAAMRAMTKARIVGDAVAHYRQYLNGRPAIVFCMGVKHTHEVAAMFCEAGIKAAGVDGRMEMSLRRERLAGLASGELQVVTAADVISEGVDIPAVAGAILLRPTVSTSLYLQQVGRALRLKPDGSRAIILDHVGNAQRHGIPTDPRLWSLDAEQQNGKAQNVVTCKLCHRVFHEGTARKIAGAECHRSPCAILKPEPKVTEEKSPDVVKGTLEAVEDRWAWAKGIDPYVAHGPELTALIAHAGADKERLEMIARARGYKHGWVRHRLRAAGADIPMNRWEKQQAAKKPARQEARV